MGIDQVPELIAAGVSCLKIEGRLKGAEFVAITTAAYREAVDTAWAALHAGAPTDRARLGAERRAELVPQLAQVFSRAQDAEHNGLTPGFLEGPQHQRLVRGRSPSHRGVLAGEVIDVRRPKHGGGGEGEVLVRLQLPLKRGDGVVFDGGRRGMRERAEEGGAIYSVADARTRRELSGETSLPEEVMLGFGRGAIADWSNLRAGDLVWRTRDASTARSVRSLGRRPARAAPPIEARAVRASVSGSIGTPLKLTLVDALGREATQNSDGLLEAARKVTPLYDPPIHPPPQALWHST